ncbi:MAG: hypothetical protein KDA24_21315 [Deltaproteobacteria bacterium]|nr:hypothetical protein [Deltaproteobacteria bacterium]
MTGIEIFGAWLSIFLTVCVLSFLYDDNPIYKLAEHLFLGVSIGYGVIEIYFGVFKPNLLDKLMNGELGGFQRSLSIIPLILIFMLFSKLVPKYSWLARIPIAFIVAAYAGVKLTGELNANLMTQVAQSIPDLGAVWAEYGFWSWKHDGAGVFSSLFLVLGLSACLLHFYFSAPQNKAMQQVSRFGVLTLMLSFGASFGYTVMGRISLAIGRAQEMLGLDRLPEQVAQIHPRIATVVSAAIVIAFLVVWRRRQGDDYTPGN